MAQLFEHDIDRRFLRGQLAWFITWAAVTFIGAVVLHADHHGHGTHTQLGLPPCGSVLLFDRPCPGCGMTTSWTALLHGNFGQALSANLMGPFLYLAFTLTALASVYGYLTGKKLRSDTPKANKVLWITVLVFVGYGAIRFAVAPLNSPFHKPIISMLGR